MKEELLLKVIEHVDPGRYDMNHMEGKILLEKNAGSPFELMYDGFRYGFLKGQRAARAELKKKAAKA